MDDATIAVVADAAMAAANRSISFAYRPTKFDGRASMTLEAYLKRIVKFSDTDRKDLVIAVCYVNRAIEMNDSFAITHSNMHRLILSAVLLTTKFWEDRFMSNRYFARLGGISLGEMNALEIELLMMLSCDLCIAPEVYSAAEARVARGELVVRNSSKVHAI